jgi:hypothetical protein
MTTQQLWDLALPLIVAIAAYVRAELAHHTAASAAAGAAAPAPGLIAHHYSPPPDPADVIAQAPSADLWAQLEHRGWSLAAQPFPPPPAAAAWPPLPQPANQANV